MLVLILVPSRGFPSVYSSRFSPTSNSPLSIPLTSSFLFLKLYYISSIKMNHYSSHTLITYVISEILLFLSFPYRGQFRSLFLITFVLLPLSFAIIRIYSFDTIVLGCVAPAAAGNHSEICPCRAAATTPEPT